MTETSGARPLNVTTDDLTNDEYDRLTPAQVEKLSTVADAGDLPVSHLSDGYDQPASASFVYPGDPRVAAGEVAATDTAESSDGAPAEAFEGNGDDDRSLILPDADPDGADTGAMPPLDD